MPLLVAAVGVFALAGTAVTVYNPSWLSSNSLSLTDLLGGFVLMWTPESALLRGQ